MNTVTIKKFNLNEIGEELLLEVKEVFSKAYYNEHMYISLLNDMKEAPEIFQAFFAYLENKIIGVAIIETKPHKFIQYHGFAPVHIKRFTVLPEHRSLGIGKKLLDEAKEYAFKEKKVPVIFGESNEIGALSFYGREGALYSTKVIKNYSERNSADENIYFFKEFISNKKFKSYRYPEGKGIIFVLCSSDKEKLFFETKGFVSKEDLLKTHI